MTAPSQKRGGARRGRVRPAQSTCRFCGLDGRPVKAVDRLGKRSRVCRNCRGVAA